VHCIISGNDESGIAKDEFKISLIIHTSPIPGCETNKFFGAPREKRIFKQQ
jgi:hypothetical protein